MTREDAIKRLEDTFEAWEGWIPHNDSPASKLAEALGMAIAALKEQSRPEASNQQVTEPLRHNGFSGSEEAPASKNQVKGIRLMARPWQPQDLLDDLQLMIDEEPDSYLNDRRTTLCMARGFLKEHFAESGWISVEDRLPEVGKRVLVYSFFDGMNVGWVQSDGRFTVKTPYPDRPTHWMPLPEPPEVDAT